MHIHCRKYKASCKSIHETEPSFLRSFFDKLMPDTRFRFITFEKDDYRKSCLTFLFCSEIPEKVMVNVDYPVDVAPAIREIVRLNTRIQWDRVQFFYPTAEPAGNITIILNGNLTDYACN